MRFPLALAEMASNAARWSRLFGSVKGAVIGMIHVQALPGKAFESQESTHCMDTKSCLYSSDACMYMYTWRAIW